MSDTEHCGSKLHCGFRWCHSVKEASFPRRQSTFWQDCTWQRAKWLSWWANTRWPRPMFSVASAGISPPRDSSWGSRVPPSGCPDLLAVCRWSGHGRTLPSAEPDSLSPPTGTRWPLPPICRRQETHKGIIARREITSRSVQQQFNLLLTFSHSPPPNMLQPLN